VRVSQVAKRDKRLLAATPCGLRERFTKGRTVASGHDGCSRACVHESQRHGAAKSPAAAGYDDAAALDGWMPKAHCVNIPAYL
jgi:hypothetical protein